MWASSCSTADDGSKNPVLDDGNRWTPLQKKKLVYAHFRTDKSGKDVLPEEDATAVKFRSVSMVCVLVCVYIPSESRDTHKICRSSLEKVRLIEFPIESGRFLLIISKIGRIPIS